MLGKVKVSVLCLSYNQVDYIEECLDSILMQKTNFDFEVLINDDASNDGTKEIIEKYQKKYPKIIKPNYQKENQYSQGKRNMIVRYLLPHAKGKYLAICEGDDYWTDPHKLQKQVDFLDENPEYSLCFHPVKVFFENGEEKDSVYPTGTTGFTVERLLEGNFIQTNSVMYRARSKPEYSKLSTDVMPGDWYLHLYHAQFGKIGFINKVMSAYRRHEGGIWWSAVHKKGLFWKHNIDALLNLYRELYKMYGEDIGKVSSMRASLASMLNEVIEDEYINSSRHFLEVLFKKHPKLMVEYAKQCQSNVGQVKKLNTELSHTIKLKDNHIKNIENQRSAIKNSKTWKTREWVDQQKRKLF